MRLTLDRHFYRGRSSCHDKETATVLLALNFRVWYGCDSAYG
ncbi:hypothetical protein CY0110_16507 [Crocosphaera chwakensis CCY0110]|uniref:Uncharacterized protein n=1 Tax=Crocosphaera chwakensis CCY0110 TaxID=391612 RepID=A3IHY3_9CHRO|nr:hypothetical protein CY0110_16507 [Crocosphaera chwakensis CCY0110]